MTKFEWYSLLVSWITIGISLLVASATIWYVRIASKTLKEIALQRINTFFPEIVIEGLPFFTYTDSENNFPIEFTYTKRVPESSDLFIIQMVNLKLKCYNVGLGAAKNVKSFFDFKIQEAVNIIHEFSPHHKPSGRRIFNISFDRKNLSIEHLNGVLCVGNIDEPEVQSFILPISVTKNPTEIALPVHISHLYAIYTYLKWIKTENIQKMKNFPTIKARFIYQDINNNNYEKENSIELNWTGGRSEETWNEMKVSN